MLLMLAAGRRSAVTIEEALHVLEGDRSQHMTAQPATELELDHLEEALGQKLPEEFRTFLARFGGGILYERHEIFGARRLMIHDIELVPDLVSFRHRFVDSGGQLLADDLVPFHRADGVVHLLDLRRSGEARIVSADGKRSYPDLACFLEQVVLARESSAGA
jgi:SMI1-KNR4 cell-wall